MKIAGFLLLLSGGFLVLTALIMLPTAGSRTAFIVAGLAVEILGLVLVIRAHIPREEPR
jgi:hypothetical protein